MPYRNMTSHNIAVDAIEQALRHLIQSQRGFTFDFKNGNGLQIKRQLSHYAQFKPGYEVIVQFLEHRADDGCYVVCAVEHFSLANQESAIEAFMTRLMGPNPHRATDLGQSVESFFVRKE
ncbi:hypothetical protein [Achromobacter phage Motura]|uniref:Uncharacterized protein n=1 Tax=Achromobacter phage Motura TaxID=2591403 RepID=A0A514CSQ1_9CAUD|nr:hypothetical protein H1O15_gp303 [Achromobacter phage Motura]QDH83503.1 hypothetical protein [Achromobacter phage Motura]